MKKISVLDRILLLLTVLLAAYQISFGLYNLNPLSTWSYTIGFGVLLVAGLLLIILGFEGLESHIVVIVSALIPLSISMGLIVEHVPQFMIPNLIFAVFGFAAIAFTRYTAEGKTATIILAITHGIAGSTITILPLILSIQGKVAAGYFIVGIAGALMGIGGLLLTFLKAGKPILSQKTIFTLLPTLLMLMTAAFVYGFSFR